MRKNFLAWLRFVALPVVLLFGTTFAFQNPVTATTNASSKPFMPPFRDPPGPGTWMLGQAYGNTIFAYPRRDDLYGRSGGIHFGIDLTAPCGTPVVAIGDGVVFAVDNLNFGAAPHNLIIDHPKERYASLYGHLLEKPTVRVGQQVKQGEVVALSGDPAGSGCYSRPHLHLEIRDLATHARKFNPVLLINANWEGLALITPSAAFMEYNLDNPRQWQHLDDQPEAVSGGTLLNDFKNAWPPAWKDR